MTAKPTGGTIDEAQANPITGGTPGDGTDPTTKQWPYGIVAQPETSPGRLSFDVVFGILRNERRRRVLVYLMTESDTCRLGELAEHLAALENDKPVRLLSSQERKRTYIALYQCHLPKLDDAGVVDFDRDTVTLREPAFQLAPYLDLEDGTDDGRAVPRRVALAASVGVSLAVLALALTVLLRSESLIATALAAVTVGLPAAAFVSLYDRTSR